MTEPQPNPHVELNNRSLTMEQVAKLAGLKEINKHMDTETRTLQLLVQLTGVVDKALDRILELERKAKHQAMILDRLQEFSPDVGIQETPLERKEAYDG